MNNENFTVRAHLFNLDDTAFFSFHWGEHVIASGIGQTRGHIELGALIDFEPGDVKILIDKVDDNPAKVGAGPQARRLFSEGVIQNITREDAEYLLAEREAQARIDRERTPEGGKATGEANPQ